jgi:hypothetical protein
MRLFYHIFLRPVHVHVTVCTCVVGDRDHFPLLNPISANLFGFVGLRTANVPDSERHPLHPRVFVLHRGDQKGKVMRSEPRAICHDRRGGNAHARESQESGKHWASSRAFSLKAPGMRRDRRLLTKLVRKAYSLQST